MTVTDILGELRQRGVILEPHGDRLRYRAPRGMLTPDLREALLENKIEILSTIRRVGDGEDPPPLGRSPANECELRRLIDHLADPEEFNRWLEWAINHN